MHDVGSQTSVAESGAVISQQSIVQGLGESKVGPFGSCVDRDGLWCNYVLVPSTPEFPPQVPKPVAGVAGRDCFDEAKFIFDLEPLQMRTYDCSHAALRFRLHRRLQADAELLSVQLQSGCKQLKSLSADMQGLVDLGVSPTSGPSSEQGSDDAQVPLAAETLLSDDVGNGIDKVVFGAGGAAFCVVDDVWIPSFCVDSDDEEHYHPSVPMDNLAASVSNAPAGKYVKLWEDLQHQVHLAASQAASRSNQALEEIN